jgi:hypothetical protein
MKLFKNFNSNLYILGVLAIALMFACAFAFYRERVMNFDAAFFAFQMIDSTDFSIALGRWGAALAQILPLAALKSGASMNTFLRLFSVAPIINYLILFSCIHLWMKNFKASLLFLFTISLFFRQVFYYTTAELYFGMAMCVLFYALLSDEESAPKIKRDYVFAIVVAVLTYSISYFHQLTVFALVFTVMHLAVFNADFKNRRLWMAFGIIVCWFFVRIFVLKASSYESEKIPSLSTLIEQLGNLKQLPSTDYFIHFFRAEYMPVVLAYALSMVYWLVQRKWLYVLFNVAFNAGFLTLILLTYYKGESPLMYQNYYVMFGLFCGLPIAEMVMHAKWQWFKYAVTVFLLAFSLNGIYSSHHVFTKKVEYLERLVGHAQQSTHKKFLIHNQNFNWKVSWVSWSLPFETALLSADNSNGQSATFCLANEYSKYDSLLNKENVFLGPDWAPTWFGSQNLSKRYFSYPSSGYVKLNTSQSDTSFHIERFNKENVSIIPVKRFVVSDDDAFVVAPMRIENRSGYMLHSIPDSTSRTFLSYRLYDSSGALISKPSFKSALEADVDERSLITGLTVDLPRKGTYRMVVDFVTDDTQWWGIDAECILEVK